MGQAETKAARALAEVEQGHAGEHCARDAGPVDALAHSIGPNIQHPLERLFIGKASANLTDAVDFVAAEFRNLQMADVSGLEYSKSVPGAQAARKTGNGYMRRNFPWGSAIADAMCQVDGSRLPIEHTCQTLTRLRAAFR